MSLTVKINYESYIGELVNKNNIFSFLENKKLPKISSLSWSRDGKDILATNVIFIGKTGYGKSTTLNAIVGKDVFETNDIGSCTKSLYKATYQLKDKDNSYFSLVDLPGIGENLSQDIKYREWYYEFWNYCETVVYILRCDQRDFSLDEDIFSTIFKSELEKKKVILALNYVDKIEPINRKSAFIPTEAQIININKKVNEVSEIFGIPKSRIISYSATEKYNIDKLVECIVENTKRNLFAKIKQEKATIPLKIYEQWRDDI